MNNNIKIMVVDDDQYILDFFENTFKILGYQAVLVPNGIEALKVFKKEDPDIVFLDIRMPHIDGIETLKRMKNLDVDNHTMIIMLTGYGDLTTVRDAMRLGAHDYVTKPINLSLIEAFCEEVIKEKVEVNA